MSKELVQWQKYAPNGHVYPWFTHPFLDWLEKQDLKDKNILETGGGRSTAWWRSRSKWVDTLEANMDWAIDIHMECSENGLNNGRVLCSGDIPDSVPARRHEYFDLIPTDVLYNVIVVDGIYRYEMLRFALNYFHDHNINGLLIADNWKQAFVWISEPSERLMSKYPIHVFEQEDHTDNDGVNKWKTVYWNI